MSARLVVAEPQSRSCARPRRTAAAHCRSTAASSPADRDDGGTVAGARGQHRRGIFRALGRDDARPGGRRHATAGTARTSPHTAPVGKILSGLKSWCGSKTSRTRPIAARSCGVEDERERVAFLVPDAVLAADRAAHRDAGRENLGPRFDDRLHRARVAPVEAQERVQVAVAGVIEVADRARRTRARCVSISRVTAGSFERGTHASWM